MSQDIFLSAERGRWRVDAYLAFRAQANQETATNYTFQGIIITLSYRFDSESSPLTLDRCWAFIVVLLALSLTDWPNG